MGTFWKAESVSAFRAMHGSKSEPDWRIPWVLVMDFVSGSLELRLEFWRLKLNKGRWLAPDESIQEAGGKTDRIDTIVNDVKFFAHKLRKW